MERANFDVRQTRIMGDGKFTITQNPGPSLNFQAFNIHTAINLIFLPRVDVALGLVAGRDPMP